MVIQIEIRKIEKTFGNDKWAIRVGDIVGSTSMHNCSRTDLIKFIITEIDDEAKRVSDSKINKIILSKVFDKAVEGIEIKIAKKYHHGTGNVNAICYNFKQELKERLLKTSQKENKKVKK